MEKNKISPLIKCALESKEQKLLAEYGLGSEIGRFSEDELNQLLKYVNIKPKNHYTEKDTISKALSYIGYGIIILGIVFSIIFMLLRGIEGSFIVNLIAFAISTLWFSAIGVAILGLSRLIDIAIEIRDKI